MMKKAMMALVAAVMMSANALAQDNEQVQAPQQPVMDKAEMIKARTEQMVKEYELTEEQAGLLLELNTEFADKMPMMMGPGPRDGRRQRGEFRQGSRIENGEGRPMMRERRPDNADRRPMMRDRRQMPSDSTRQAMPMRRMGDREEMRKVMEDYNTGVKKIFTEEQFKKYQENMEQRRMQGQRGRRGAAPQTQQQ